MSAKNNGENIDSMAFEKEIEDSDYEFKLLSRSANDDIEESSAIWKGSEADRFRNELLSKTEQMKNAYKKNIDAIRSKIEEKEKKRGKEEE